VHLYASSTAEIPLGDRVIKLEQTTNYPWDGRVAIRVNSPGRFTLNLRIPDWSTGGTILLNGRPHEAPSIARDWRAGDEVVLDLPMPAQRIASHPHVVENTGRVAITRGPLVYCTESVDNPDIDLRDVELWPDAPIDVRHDASLLSGVTKLITRARVNAPPSKLLYQSPKPAETDLSETDVTFIPYYAFANRAAGRMQVWHRTHSA
jgi:DUF1680 family protein